MRLVLLGPPGAGKGTQAERICAARGLVHVSTGDLLREAVRLGTDLGVEAKTFMDRGELVPDALVLSLLEERIGRPDAQAGCLLDGFPRNTSQAQSLEVRLGDEGLDAVVHLHLDDEEIVRRLLARGRADDSESVIRNRLEVYATETAPLIRFYEERGLLATIDATGSIDDVAGRVAAVLGEANRDEANRDEANRDEANRDETKQNETSQSAGSSC